MINDIEKWSLVILGKWNTAILSPDWLAREVFNKTEVQIMYPVLGGGPPIFEANDMRVVVSGERIMFIPHMNTDENLNRIESAAMNVLNILHHTPISAFGENFYYTVDMSTKQLDDVFVFSDTTLLEKAYVMNSGMSLRRTINIENCQLNLTITSGENYQIEMNYHYNVDSASQAAQLMNNTYIRNRNHSLELLENVYNLTLDKEAINDEKSR